MSGDDHQTKSAISWAYGPLGIGRHWPVDRDAVTVCLKCGAELKNVKDLKQPCPGES